MEAFKQYLDISHFKCLWAKCLIGISVATWTPKTNSKNQIHDTMSFRHLRLNNNNEHFIYYPPSYQMINYFPKDSFRLCLSFSYARSRAFVRCAFVHLSTSFWCQMRILYTIHTSILSRIDTAKFCTMLIMWRWQRQWWERRRGGRHVHYLACIVQLNFFQFSDRFFRSFFVIHSYWIILSNELILFLSLSLPTQQSLYNQSNHTDRNENTGNYFHLSRRNAHTHTVKSYVFVDYAAAFDFQENYCVTKMLWPLTMFGSTVNGVSNFHFAK